MPEIPQSTFLVANLKELEVSGSIKLGNKTVTTLLDSADVASISGSGIDSAATIALIDSAYIQARQTSGGSVDSAATITLVQANSVDSSEVVSLIDSSYISTRFPTGGSSTVIVPVAFAQVNTTNNLFLIRSGSRDLLTITQSGVLVLSTQSVELTGSAPVGGVYFTSSSFFVGLE